MKYWIIIIYTVFCTVHLMFPLNISKVREVTWKINLLSLKRHACIVQALHSCKFSWNNISAVLKTFIVLHPVPYYDNKNEEDSSSDLAEVVKYSEVITVAIRRIKKGRHSLSKHNMPYASQSSVGQTYAFIG